MKISLIGYMGSGKSTIGRELSEQLNIPFIDLDKYLESKENSSISDIFNKKGQVYFRNIERKYLLEILNKPKFILSLGGGTPCYFDNMDVVNANSTSIFIRTRVDILSKRLEKEKENRPIISNLKTEELTEFVAKHLFERNEFYNKSKITIDNNGDVSNVVENIKKHCI